MPSSFEAIWLLVLAPWLEEIVFRLGLHDALLRRWGGCRARLMAWPGRANLAVAVAFGLAHALAQGPWLGVGVLLPALIVGQLYETTHRLWPCVATHALFNLCWLGWRWSSSMA